MTACLAKYGSGDNLLRIFNPSRQIDFTANLARAYLGEAPALAVVSRAFGLETSMIFLIAHLRDASEYAGVRDKLDGAKAKQIAEIVLYKWSFLKITELMHFFLKLKSGDYGRFYGTVDPMMISEALGKYAKDRVTILAKLDDELRPQREAQAREERRRYEERLIKALAKWNMTPAEFFEVDHIYGYTIDDLEEFGWLFRQP